MTPHICVCVYVCLFVYVCMCMYVCIIVCMYCMYVCMFIFEYILASQVWFQAVARAQTYGTNSPAITSHATLTIRPP